MPSLAQFRKLALLYLMRLATVIGFCLLTSMSAQAVPTVSLAQPVYSIAPSAKSVSGAMVLVVVDPAATADIPVNLVERVADLKGVSTGPALIFGAPRALAYVKGDKQRRWLLPFTVASVPRGLDEARYVDLKLGGEQHTLAYQLRASAVLSDWTIKPPPSTSVALSPSGMLSLNVVLDSGSSLTRMQLGAADLVEEDSLERLGDGQLVACPTVERCSGGPFSVTPPGGRIWVGLRLGADAPDGLWPGKYNGSVMLMSDSKPDGQSVNMTVYVTHWSWKLLGISAIGLGVAVAYWFSTALRTRILRNQLLIQAVELRADIDRLTSWIRGQAFTRQIPQVQARLQQLNTELSDAALERHGLPARMPNLTPRVAGSPDAAVYQTYVSERRSWVEMLRLQVTKGFAGLQIAERARVQGAPPLTAAEVTQYNTAWKEIDLLANGPLLTNETLNAKLTAIHASVLPPPPAPAPNLLAYGARSTGEERDPQRVQADIDRDNRLGWLFITAVTILGGSLFLVIGNKGFGTPYDLIGCLAWGLGLPAGTVLATSTTASLSNTFNSPRRLLGEAFVVL